MAYDKECFDAIQVMGVGDLVHFMLTQFTPVSRRAADDGYDHPSVQSTEYFWAFERLNKLLPSPPTDNET